MLDVAGGILIVLALLAAVVVALAKFEQASMTAGHFAAEDRLKGGAILVGVVGFVVWLLFGR